jgi:hypothetical protein
MHDVLQEFKELVIGTSITSGSGTTIVINGNAPMAADPRNDLEDGQRAFIHRYYSDFTTAAFERGYAEWDNTNDQFINYVVTASSHADGVSPINWTTDEQYVVVRLSAQASTQWAKIQAGRELGAPWVIAYSGQSNMHAGLDNDSTFPTIPAGFVKDYCTDQLGPFSKSDTLTFKDYNGADRTREHASDDATWVSRYNGTFRSHYKFFGSPGDVWYQTAPPTSNAAGDLWWDTDDGHHLYKAAAGGVSTIGAGAWETQEAASNWSLNAHMGVLFAYWMALNTGCMAYTIGVSSTGTVIDQATKGWFYNPGNGNTADDLDTIVTAALAETEISSWGITAPHFFIFAQGEGAPIVEGKTSAQQAMYLGDFIEAIYDSERWGWAKDGQTTTFILDIPPGVNYRKSAPTWSGHRMAVARHPHRAVLISTDGLRQWEDTWDTVHYNDKGAIKLAYRLLNAALATGIANKQPNPVMELVRRRSDPEPNGTGLSSFNQNFDINNTVPPPSGNTYVNTTGDTIVIYKSNDSIKYAGISHIKNNDADDTSDATITITNLIDKTYIYNITGPIKDRDTYFEIPVSLDTGSPATLAAALHFFRCQDEPAAPVSYAAMADVPMGSAALAEGNSTYAGNEPYPDRSPVLADPDGVIYRQNRIWEAHIDEAQYNGAGPHDVWTLNLAHLNVSGNIIFCEAILVGVNASDNTDTFAYEIKQNARRTGAAAAWSLHGSIHEVKIEQAGNPVDDVVFIFANHNTLFTHNLRIQMTGNAGVNYIVSGRIKIMLVDGSLA